MHKSASLHYSFAGRRVLVTGGASGIGRGIVQKFYDDGAQVFVIDRNSALLETLKKELPKVNTFCVDLLNWGETRRVVESLAPLDHLVNNAGIAKDTPLHEATEDWFDKIIGVNVKAVLNVSQAFVKGIVGHGKVDGGTIVNISSICDTLAMHEGGVYCASKGAVTMLTKSMALEFAELNNRIRVNCVCPGMVRTPLFSTVKPELIEKLSAQLGVRAIVKHRELEPADIANGVLFLSSPLAEMITGTSLVIDQGLRVT